MRLFLLIAVASTFVIVVSSQGYDECSETPEDCDTSMNVTLLQTGLQHVQKKGVAVVADGVASHVKAHENSSAPGNEASSINELGEVAQAGKDNMADESAEAFVEHSDAEVTQTNVAQKAEPKAALPSAEATWKASLYDWLAVTPSSVVSAKLGLDEEEEEEPIDSKSQPEASPQLSRARTSQTRLQHHTKHLQRFAVGYWTTNEVLIACVVVVFIVIIAHQSMNRNAEFVSEMKDDMKEDAPRKKHEWAIRTPRGLTPREARVATPRGGTSMGATPRGATPRGASLVAKGPVVPAIKLP